jgi:hypothetical protein
VAQPLESVAGANSGKGGVCVIMRTLKSQGRREVQALLRRVRRQLAMNRIAKADAIFIEERLLDIDGRIVNMHEVNELGKEEEISAGSNKEDNGA